METEKDVQDLLNELQWVMDFTDAELEIMRPIIRKYKYDDWRWAQWNEF